jgi:prolyl-tRNA synthetase
MGGSESEEFLAPLAIGEDTFAQAPSGKAWNVEALTTVTPDPINFSDIPAATNVATPGKSSVDDVVAHLNATVVRADGRTDGKQWQASDALKNFVITATYPDGHKELICVGLPGDRQVDMKRLEAGLSPAQIEESTPEELAKHPELVRGFIGPMVLGPQAKAAGIKEPVRYLLDAHIARGSAWVSGANVADTHTMNLVYGRDFEADGIIEAAQIRHGDMSPDGSGPLSFERGVEIGQVFQLGLKYSKALGLNVLNEQGKSVPVWMGSYGIGVSRVMACIAEAHHDDRGLAWPKAIAPAQVHVVAAGKEQAAWEAAENLVAELEAQGVEVIFDDRAKVSPGVKFKDAELLGVPLIAVAGRDTAQNGTIEIRDRDGGNVEQVPIAAAVDAIKQRI